MDPLDMALDAMRDRRANAERLRNAAPAMLEALEGAQARLCEARCMKHEELATSHIAECNQARAAIAQAKGGK